MPDVPAPPATFFQRLSAWVFDTSLACLPATALAYLGTAGARADLAQRQPGAMADGSLALDYLQDLLGLWIAQGAWVVVLTAAIYGLGSVAAESGVWQATWGKRLVGINVEAAPGGGEGWQACAVRFLAGSLSWLSLNIGHAMIRWRPDGRALHDLLSGMRVAQEPMPAERRRRGLAACWGAWLVVGVGLALLSPSDPVLDQVLAQAIEGLTRPAL